MALHPVLIPRLNPNEDRVVIVEVVSQEGKSVTAGDPLAIVETTKATVEISAPCEGVVRGIHVKQGDEPRVGSILCHIATQGEELPAQPSEPPRDEAAAADGPPRTTAKARALASELGINLANVPPVRGRIGAAEVEAYARTSEQAVPGAADTTVPTSGRAVVLGGGRHAPCVIDALRGSDYDLIGCLDSQKPKDHPVFAGLKVIGPLDAAFLERLRAEHVSIAVMGVGGAIDNRPRADLFKMVSEAGFIMPPVIHPAAYVAEQVPVGPATVVLAKASIGPHCRIGANVLVNQGSIVCHNTVILDHAHIAPGGILAGACRIGAGATIGMGATVYMDVSIGAWSLIHNGVSIVADVPDHAVVKRSTHLAAKTSKRDAS